MAYKDKEAKRAYDRQYASQNREKILAQKKEYYLNNRERILAYSKSRYLGNKKVILSRGKEYREDHRIRINARTRKWRAENPEKVRDNNLKQSGWTLRKRREAWDRQQGKCAICGIELIDYGRSNIAAHGDHDHETGEPRDLLCARCNRRLGHLERDPEWVSAAIAYLEKHCPDKLKRFDFGGLCRS